MTLIIGIKCKDGIVMGADGAATLGLMGQSTIRQSVRNKIRRLGSDQGMVGVSGSVGLGQRIYGEIDATRNAGKIKGKPHEFMTELRQALWKHIEMEIQIARIASQAAGASALATVLTGTLAAVVVAATEPYLIWFDHQGVPELATDDLPFMTIGSGQAIADPFLAFLRRIYWPNTVPTVEQGVFATIWTLYHAIQTNPGGVGEPIQIVTLQKDGQSCKAKEMPEAEWQETLELIQELEKAIASLPKQLEQEVQPSQPPPALPT